MIFKANFDERAHIKFERTEMADFYLKTLVAYPIASVNHPERPHFQLVLAGNNYFRLKDIKNIFHFDGLL
ncbi:hypothetical protein GCM10008943_10210 [Paenochrobactrum glaciei]|uniref:Uncharacterized protein n=1 Tax=Paenochrobactrum glaciei TaxID=486407 RepID=A0ABP3QTA6_9HYPH